MKILKKISILCCFSLFSFGANEVYFIKADGEFGKEIAQIAKEYAQKNGKSVEIFVDEDPRKYKDTRLIKAGVDKRGRYSASLGKELFETKCAPCHGTDMQKRPSGTTMLKDMDAKDIEDSIISYRSDSSFGKSTRSVMQNIAKSITNSELGAIIFYIKGKDAYANDVAEVENQPVSTQKSRGSYLR